MKSVVYIVSFLTVAVLAFVLRRSFRTRLDEPLSYRLFGWVQAAIGILLIVAYYFGNDRSPDTIALGWGLTVFGGYMVESGVLRRRIVRLEKRIEAFSGSPPNQY